MMTLGPEEMVYLTLDSAAILAVAIILYLTEKPVEKPDQYKEREKRIHAMLDDAVANEYDITTWTVDDIVADLLAFADLNDDEGEEVIKPHVLTWKMIHGVST